MIQDSLTVITGQARIVFGILLFTALGQGLAVSALKSIFGRQLTSNEYLALSLGGWTLPVSLLSLCWIFLGRTAALTVFLLLLILAFFLARLQSAPEPDSRKITFSLLTFMSVSILLRLAFAERAILPSYFDSAQHYSLVKTILLNGAILPAGSPYYHMGFHTLTAFLVTLLDTDIAKTMLILGQMVLAVMPVSVFFLIQYATQSYPAAFVAAILSAFGWYMPAHAVNWGKYPALLSLGLIPFVLGMAFLMYRNSHALSSPKRTAAYSLLALGVFITILFHSRILIILSMAGMAWIIAVWRERLPRPWRGALFVVVLVFLALDILILQRQSMAALLFDPYLQKGTWITVLAVLLSVFAWMEFPQASFTCLLFTGLLLGGLFIPIQIPGYGPLTLLDRPLVEMILHLPLALLGGLGWAGLEKILPQTLFRGISGRGFLFVSVSGLVLVHAFTTYQFYPSECCEIAGHDDMAAMTWMDAHLPADARIGISVTELEVVPSNELEGYAGGDAGIWITPLIDRFTMPLLHSSHFGDQAARELLCRNKVSHLYVGEFGQSFDSTELNAHPEWYQTRLSMPVVKVYEVVGCG